MKSGTHAFFAFGPDPSAVAFDDAAHDGQAHAFTLGERGMETLKYLE